LVERGLQVGLVVEADLQVGLPAVFLGMFSAPQARQVWLMLNAETIRRKQQFALTLLHRLQ
jgi:hypothetical protein